MNLRRYLFPVIVLLVALAIHLSDRGERPRRPEPLPQEPAPVEGSARSGPRRTPAFEGPSNLRS